MAKVKQAIPEFNRKLETLNRVIYFIKKLNYLLFPI